MSQVFWTKRGTSGAAAAAFIAFFSSIRLIGSKRHFNVGFTTRIVLFAPITMCLRSIMIMTRDYDAIFQSRLRRRLVWRLRNSCFMGFMVQLSELWGTWVGFLFAWVSYICTPLSFFSAWVGSLSVCVSYLSTPLSFEVIHRIKFRAAMLLGACLSGLGLLISAYADSIYVLYITFGLMFGFGSSLCYSSSLLILPHYFTKNWSLAHGIALSGNGLGGLGLSPANGVLLSAIGLRMGFKVMAAVSFTVLFTCGMIYRTPEEKEEVKGDEEDENEEEEEIDVPEEYFPPTIWKNKPLLVFLFSTYLLNFGYYVPYVHLVKMAMDFHVPSTKAALLPGYLSLAQSCGKVFIGKVFSYGRVNRIFAYQMSLIVLSLATTFVPTLTNYPGLIVYAILFGFSDGCGQATNMIIIGDLAGKKLLPKAYSTFLVCSASAFVVGPPLAGLVYTTTGEYSIAFFMCGGMAFASALCLFVVPCLRDEDLYKMREQRRLEILSNRNVTLQTGFTDKSEENKNRRDSGISDIEVGIPKLDTGGSELPESSENAALVNQSTSAVFTETAKSTRETGPLTSQNQSTNVSPNVAQTSSKTAAQVHSPRVRSQASNARLERVRRRTPSRASIQRSQEFNKAMLTRSWHSIDFKPRKTEGKSRNRSVQH